MAEKEKKKKRGNYCAAGGPNKSNCANNSSTPGISMHYFPKDETLRQKWIRFVRIHRKDFVPSKSATLCSVHFEETWFESKPWIITSSETGESLQPKRCLKKGAVPTRDTVVPLSSPLTSRKRRSIMRDVMSQEEVTSKKAKLSLTSDSSGVSASVPDDVSPLEIDGVEESDMPVAGPSGIDYATITSGTPICSTPAVKAPQAQCNKCKKHAKQRKAMKKKVDRLEKRVEKLKGKLKVLKEVKAIETELDVEKEEEEEEEEEEKYSAENNEDNEVETDDLEENELTDDGMEDQEGDDDNIIDWATLEDSAPSAEEYSSQSDDESDKLDPNNTIRVEPGTPSYNEPKFIVFFSMLLSLFTMVCFKCKKSKPVATMKQRGTMVIVSQDCPKCGENAFHWRSQPLIFGKYPAGNILLSFGVLMAGASISKILLVFRHMGLAAYSPRTFFVHQKSFLFPIILSYWERYRASLIAQLKNVANVVWSGDGRFDSMGHSAKYGAYTMFCNTILKVVHFELLQANETGGSSPMELEGAKRCFSFLKSVGISVLVFISDRHRGIAKWIRECQPTCSHYFDIWHIARSIGKAMLKLGKEKGCEKICDWMKGVRNHLYWCVTSTKLGHDNMIEAKWKSFMRHVTNKHDGHGKDFGECAHGDIGSRRWIKIGTKAYDKLNKLLTNTRIVNDIKNMSPDAQTSCLEGFHSTLNHWHPKMVCFSWLGTFCRHILASLHFNENVRRETKKSKDGEDYIRVNYPKYKLGEEVVREVTVAPTYGYVEELKEELFSLTKSEIDDLLKSTSAKYKAPAPLSSQFTERVNKEQAVEKYRQQKDREATKLHPPEEEQDKLHEAAIAAQAATAKKARKRRPGNCRTCGKPMLGHKSSQCRPKE